MRRSRRGSHHSGMEFGGSGEDSFVAVVVTKLTGALLFILLLTMVIMALLPKAIDLPSAQSAGTAEARLPLAINTPGELPEAIAGRPYTLALAATGGHGPLHWAVDGALPDGLVMNAALGQIHGTPTRGTPEPSELNIRVSDGSDRTSRATRLVVYQPDRPLTVPSRWKPTLPPIPWREWMEQGFGFLVLALVYLVSLSTLKGLEARSLHAIETDFEADLDAPPDTTADRTAATHRRFWVYRVLVRGATLFAFVALGFWLTNARG